MSSARFGPSAHIKAPLTPPRHGHGMVTRKRLRTVLNALALYIIAALVIGYFGVNAYSGNHGLRAKQDLDQQIAELSEELGGLKSERAGWERRVLLLKPESIDPDMLDERARVLLNYADPRELTLRRKQP
jgi:cell division protein FtsB